MDIQQLAKQAFEECHSETITAHHGGGAGRPFWNPESTQFMYVPSFQFQEIPGCGRYRYAATDENGAVHCFESESSCALLSPIWRKIPEGVVRLQVHTVNKDGSDGELIGARTFFKLASFPADLPAAACSYSEAVEKGFEYLLSQNFMRHWLEKGTPDPSYGLNVYPSKMIAAIGTAMVEYAAAGGTRAAEAVKIAENAASYLIGITPTSGATAGLPPTYELSMQDNPETGDNMTTAGRMKTIMMIYPASVGSMYLDVESCTDDGKYLDAALKIGAYYRDHVLENGSWHLIVSIKTGEPMSPNFCAPQQAIMPFLMRLYERTGDAVWKALADNALTYVEKEIVKGYNWEAQFEDSAVSANYSNLTHYGAVGMAIYYAKHSAENADYLQKAEELARFAEDQFVIWKRPAPWNRSGFDTSLWRTPCGLEQYAWYVPIDSSTANFVELFLTLYKVTGRELYLAKARALADQLTRMQQPDGMIPTHWMNDEFVHGKHFWINCMIYALEMLNEMAKI